jgi:hypothetical protein
MVRTGFGQDAFALGKLAVSSRHPYINTYEKMYNTSLLCT